MRGERRFAAQGGAIWCAAAAIIFPSLLDGFDAAFDAAVAPAQSELWLPLGVARDPSARPELCCERAHDRVCVPHAACESPLRARESDGRRLWSLRVFARCVYDLWLATPLSRVSAIVCGTNKECIIKSLMEICLCVFVRKSAPKVETIRVN